MCGQRQGDLAAQVLDLVRILVLLDYVSTGSVRSRGFRYIADGSMSMPWSVASFPRRFGRGNGFWTPPTSSCLSVYSGGSVEPDRGCRSD